MFHYTIYSFFDIIMIMKSAELAGELCKPYCRYYKPSKEEDLACMGFIIVERLIEVGLLRLSVLPFSSSGTKGNVMLGHETTMILISKVCAVCPFSEDDCDFIELMRHKAVGPGQTSAVPCGGFLYLGRLIEGKVIDIKEINQLI